jgi:hypothetical protein
MTRCTPAWLLLTLFALAPGCAKFRKARECDVLARAVSGWLARQPVPNLAQAEPKQLVLETRATAKRYHDLDRELGALEISSPDLVHRTARYRELARKSAEALDDVAGALERGDTELARRRRVEFDATSRAEGPLVAEINSACRK